MLDSNFLKARSRRDKPTRIVVVGAGFGGVYAFKRLHRRFHKDPSVELVLISDSNYFLFTPLLHEVATGNVDPVNIVEPIRKILGCCMAEFHLARVCRVDTENKCVKTTNNSIAYDYLVLAPGSKTNFFGVDGAAEYSFTLKSMSDAVRMKNHVIRTIEAAQTIVNGYEPHGFPRASLEELLTITIAGGGPTGVELAAELADFYRHTFGRYYSKEITSQIRIILLQRSNELVPQFSEKIRRRSLQSLRAKGIDVRLNTGIKEVREQSVVLGNNDSIPSRTVIWTAGVVPANIPFDHEPQREDGKIVVNEYLQIPSAPDVYAVGDIAMHKNPGLGGVTPALAQSATQQGVYAAEAIFNNMRGKRPEPFRYQHRGSLLSLGIWYAAGEVGGKVLYGRFTWWLWRTIYLSKIISWSKKVKVAIDWTYNLFQPRDISQLVEFDQGGGCEEDNTKS